MDFDTTHQHNNSRKEEVTQNEENRLDHSPCSLRNLGWPEPVESD